MRSRTGLHSHGGDDGFTLVELIIAILIIGVITVPLGDVIIGFLRNTDATTARLLESHDVQIASAYWAQDVASMGTRSTIKPYDFTQSVEGVAIDSGLFPCGTAGTVIVRLAWDDFIPDVSGSAVTTLVRVAYIKQGTELHRLRCEGSDTVVSDVTLAHDLSTIPTVSCVSPANCEEEPAIPTTVTLTLSVKDPGNRSPDPYVVTLTGQRRQS